MIRRAFALAWTLLGTAPAAAAPAVFPAHSLSVGAQGGLAYLSMSDVNEQLRFRDTTTGSRFEDLHGGWEGTADLRFALTDRCFLGAESGIMRARARDRGSSSEVRASGVPLALMGGMSVDQSEGVCVRVLAGLGALLSARFEEPGVGKADGTAILGWVGGEVELRALPALGITVQALVRSAILARPDGAPYNVDFSGGSLRAGLQAYLGRHR